MEIRRTFNIENFTLQEFNDDNYLIKATIKQENDNIILYIIGKKPEGNQELPYWSSILYYKKENSENIIIKNVSIQIMCDYKVNFSYESLKSNPQKYIEYLLDYLSKEGPVSEACKAEVSLSELNFMSARLNGESYFPQVRKESSKSFGDILVDIKLYEPVIRVKVDKEIENDYVSYFDCNLINYTEPINPIKLSSNLMKLLKEVYETGITRGRSRAKNELRQWLNCNSSKVID